jgi:hypothetical protein
MKHMKKCGHLLMKNVDKAVITAAVTDVWILLPVD